MPKYTPGRIAEFRAHLEDLECRQVPVPEFAREICVSGFTVHIWRRRFGADASPPAADPIGRRDRADVIEVSGAPTGAHIETC